MDGVYFLYLYLVRKEGRRRREINTFEYLLLRREFGVFELRIRL